MIVAAAVLLASLTVTRALTDRSVLWTDLRWALVWLGLVLAVVAVFGWLAWRSRHRRWVRFAVTGRGFGATPWSPLGLTVLAQTVTASLFTVPAVNTWRDVLAPDPDTDANTALLFAVVFTVLAAAYLAFLTLGAVLAWRAFPVELTPAGITMVGPYLYRRIPWEALAVGGPPRPLLAAPQFALAVARPDLVVQRGWALGSGSRQWPVLGLQARTHPWLVVDAIAHYVTHPEHRAAIGTADEHERLLAALTAGTTVEEAYPPVPPKSARRSAPPPASRPKPVRYAAHLTYAGVAVTVLFALADLVMAIGAQDEIRAGELAVDATLPGVASDGEPLVGFGAADFALGWAIAALTIAVAVGTVAVLLARATARGRESGRAGLVAFAMGSIAWAAFPCASPTMSVVDAPGIGFPGAVWPELWMLSRGVVFVLAVTVLVLVLQPNVTAFTRLHSTPRPAPPTSEPVIGPKS